MTKRISRKNEKTFCIAGPVKPAKHYFIKHRFNYDQILTLIEHEKYFIVHAPRQSGKTTGLLELVAQLNQDGEYCVLYVNVEPAQVARGNFKEGLYTISLELYSAAYRTFGPKYAALQSFTLPTSAQDVSGVELARFLRFWAEHEQKPIVLFIDEIDSLVGDTLICVLRQLRTGYTDRPEHFPQSVCLVGVRDVRDYRIWSDEEHTLVLGGSAFNIKAESLVLENFTLKQVRDLYDQHTQETGQKFAQEAIDYAFYLTNGQPWLVNALAYQACFREVTDRSISITKEIIERSKEVLIQRRDTHIDVLIDRLHEPRVRAIIEAIILGGAGEEQFATDDVQYVRDLGLVSRKGLQIANPIYQEIIPRELTYTKQETIMVQTAWYVRKDGSLDMHKLLVAFAQFFRENSDVWLQKFDYKEAGPHLLLMAFLQRVINGGGTIHREYALGRGRVDLFITWKEQKIVLEIKILRGAKTLPDGLVQTAEYMNTCGATEGNLVIFDRSQNTSWDEKIYERSEQVGDKAIHVWGM